MHADNQHRQERLRLSGTVLRLLAWAVLAGISAAAISRAWINHDAGWYLHVAAAWLNGAELYRDVIDTNPPLIIVLSAIPVLVAQVSHAPVTAVFKAILVAAAIGSAAGSAALSRHLYACEASRVLTGICLLFLVLPFAGADFGQREHFTALFVLPYVLASAARVAGRPASPRTEILLGVLAAFGFAMKPHFALAWVGLELAVILGQDRPRKRVRAAAVAVVVAVSIYAAVVLMAVPQYLEMASEVARVYSGLNEPASVLWGLPELRYWLVAALLCFVPLRLAHRRALLAVFAASTGFLLAALVQRKGWGYHLYPFRASVGLFFAMFIAALLEINWVWLTRSRWLRLAVVAAGFAGLVLATHRSTRTTVSPPGIEQAHALHSLVERERAESLATLSMRTLIFPSFPVVNHTGVSWVMRHHSLWFLPGLYAEELSKGTADVRFRALAEMDTLERKYYEHVIADLCSTPPRILLVEPPPASVRGGFGSIDLLAYYGQDRRFARLLPAYQPVEMVGPFTAYVRRADASCGGERLTDHHRRATRSPTHPSSP